jgi:hypothetical protein
MRMHSVISHGVIGCAGVIAGYVIATGHLAIVPSFAQTPAAGQRSTELFNRVMEDVLGRRLTVRLTERDPGNGSAAPKKGLNLRATAPEASIPCAAISVPDTRAVCQAIG